MAPTLYMLHGSPPCRAVLITAKAIGVTLIEKEVNFFRNEHLESTFSQMNPQHTIPTFLDDDGFAIWDSHAIMIYLVSKYAKNDSLYPKDFKKRAIINQRLFFESSAVFFHMRNIAKSILTKGDNFIDEEEKERVIEAYGFLDKFLDGQKWAAGDFVSIADYSLVATVSSADGVIPVDSDKFPNVFAWLLRCESLPEYQANRRGLREMSMKIKDQFSTMAPTLYMIHASPPVRAVLMTAKAIELEIKEKTVDFFHGEHLSPEFVKINPQHTIPTLVDDDGFVIWDSHAIMAYLVSKYAKNDALYPKDVQKRAIVNQRLHFNSSIIFFHMRNIAKDVFYYLRTKIDDKEKQGAIEAYDFLEIFLDSKKWIAGDFLSIADYSLVATVTSLNGVVSLDPKKYPNILAWVRRCEELPEYEANRKGLKEATELFRARLSNKM